MSFNLTIDKKKGHLHAVVTGENTPENVAAYLDAALEACRSAGCRRLLLEERLEGVRLGTIDIYTIMSEGSARSLGAFQAVAYVDVNADGDQMEFAETVAVNRGVPVRLFSTVDEAEKWLLALA